MLTNRTIWTYAAALFALAGRDDLKRKVAVRLARATARLRAEVRILAEQHEAVARSFAVQNEEGQPVAVDGGYKLADLAGYLTAWGKVLDDEQGVEMVLPTISEEDLPPKVAATTIEALWALGILADPDTAKPDDEED